MFHTVAAVASDLVAEVTEPKHETSAENTSRAAGRLIYSRHTGSCCCASACSSSLMEADGVFA